MYTKKYKEVQRLTHVRDTETLRHGGAAIHSDTNIHIPIPNHPPTDLSILIFDYDFILDSLWI